VENTFALRSSKQERIPAPFSIFESSRMLMNVAIRWLKMKITTQIFVYSILVVMLLLLPNNVRRRSRRSQGDNHVARTTHRIRLRRFGGENPSHLPMRSSKNAILPPDDDNDWKRPRAAKDSQDWILSLEQDQPGVGPMSHFDSHPLPTAVSRHQTLCILTL
jgi:hypothetical protein